MTYENLDEELVNALLRDGRESLRSLSDELDVSVTTISNHLNDLEESGGVEGFTPVVNYEAFGYDVTAIIQMQVAGDELADFTSRLEENDNLVSVFETTGDQDVIAIGKFRDTDHMNDVIKGLLSDDAVLQSNTSVVLNSVKDREQFDLPTDSE